MKEQDRRKDRSVRKCARPINIRQGSSRAALCIHGFTGYPGEMAYPVQKLAEAGWDVRAPRLSGHGTEGADFAGIRMSDLTRQVKDEWLDMKAVYDEVHVLGHSMGGLLALNLAREFQVDRLAVMAPAIGIRVPAQFLLGLVSLIYSRRPVEWKSDSRFKFFDERDEDDEAYLGKEYWSWAWLRQLNSLIRLMKYNEKRLGKIKSPVLGIFAGQDVVVGTLGRSIMEKGLGGEFRAVEIEDSGHYIPYEFHPGVKETAMDEVIRWFGESSGSEAAG